MQNAVDACVELKDFLEERPTQHPANLTEQDADVVITLHQSSHNERHLIVSDRGIGMTSSVVLNYFLKAGASFRQSDAWRQQHESKPGQSRVLRSGRFGVGALVLIRPGSQILLLLTPLALALRGSWRIRVVSAFAFAVPVLIIVGGWTLQNGVRYDDYTLARGANSGVPFYRAFVTDHIVRPGNGPASRRLAQAVQRELLPREPYKSYGVDLHEFFAEASPRMHEDLVALSNRLWGWKSDAAKLRQAGIEAVRTHPLAYARGVVTTTWQLLRQPLFISPRLPASSKDGAEKPARLGAEPIVVINGRRLPRPTEGEPIPAGQVVWISRPDQSIRQVWTSPAQWHFEFDHPADRVRFREILRERDRLFAGLPSRAGNAELALRLDQLSRWFPRPWMWMALGLIGILVRRPRGSGTLVALALAALAVVALNALGLFADLHFILPVAPAFVLLGAGGVLGVRATASRQRPA
jgi:hypothetical protein